MVWDNIWRRRLVKKEGWEMENNQLETTYESPSLITRTYFRWKMNKIIRVAKLNKEDVILDFGCGCGWLERKLRDYQIVGYDINPEKTLIQDYKNVTPTVIFALDVFEHIPLNEIENILLVFRFLNKSFKLIVSIPTENLLSRLGRRWVGKSAVPKEHITKLKDIKELLDKYFKLKKEYGFFTMSKIYIYER